jgi:hypothetical protein
MKPHTAMWSGEDFTGKPVADGKYEAFIEVTESDKEPGELTQFEFDKSAAPFTMDAPVDVDGPLLQVKLTWMPMQEGSASAAQGSN